MMLKHISITEDFGSIFWIHEGVLLVDFLDHGDIVT